jgi:hypothetical protein
MNFALKPSQTLPNVNYRQSEGRTIVLMSVQHTLTERQGRACGDPVFFCEDSFVLVLE